MKNVSKEQADKLKKGLKLSKKSMEALNKVTSKSRRRKSKLMVQTMEGDLVEPMLYFRGGKGKTPGESMMAISKAFNEIVEKVAIKHTIKEIKHGT